MQPSKYVLIKNVSSSTSHKKNSVTEKLRNFSFFLSTIIFEPILIQISMNANIKKTHILYKMKYDLKGQIRPFMFIYLVQIIQRKANPTLNVLKRYKLSVLD